MKKKPEISEEVELKFELENADLDRLLSHPLVTGGHANAARTKLLRSTYFDTPDYDLRKAGVSLRVRKDRAARIQTIKAARSSGGIALARGEWEQEVSGDKPDFSVAAGTALEPFLALSDTIQPVFEVSAHRTFVELPTDSSVVEVVVDRGEIQTSGGGRPFAELELELKEGDRAALFQIAAQLFETVPLRLSFRTKSDRGFEAISDGSERRIKAEPIVLKKKMTSRAAFVVIGASCLRHLMANESIVRAVRDPDAVHQMRVALRRLRAAISLFKNVVADEQRDKVRSELKWMADQLGQARDLDVYISKVLEPTRAAHPGEPELDNLLSEYQARRESAYDTVQEMITSSRFLRSVLDVAAWIETGPWMKSAGTDRDPRVVELAAAELNRRWKRVRKQGTRLADMHPEERHQVRIEIKKLRYASEFFESLFRQSAARKRQRAAMESLEALQEVLGDLNDIAVGAEITAASAAADNRQARISHSDDLIKAATKRYRTFAKLEPFWEP
jgi:triphosphatase